ncbi:MAG TPA: 30S ribosomal protein S9 [Candidatus Marinimicrobia bacterium]|jgi:small subunit ribosomal protein S9|nr:30S ribosomal protein S9 [Candidatus Neomarinimicrobiota bacterium]|tara:strand:- start:782 stop:1174 length:393 start_codon:yes stop_codon:yes gene_type:complete
MSKPTYYGTGRRKSSIARVYLSPGKGKITVNGRSFDDYLCRGPLSMVVTQPLFALDSIKSYDIHAQVKGGGLTGQAGALRLGIARALIQVNEDFRKELRAGGFLTRDSRRVERKKYGQPGARKRFQFSKR